MNFSPSNPLNAFSAAVLATVLVVTSALLAEARAQGRPFNIPDLSSYNCGSVDAGSASSVRHVGQVIKGRYYEWHEIYADVGGRQKLACISLVVPEARQMSVGEARAFLKDASAVGTPDTSSFQAPRQEYQNSATDPLHVPPMPLKRAIKPAPGTGSKEKQAGEIEVPPIPAIKSFKASGKTAPGKETVISKAGPQAPPFSYETPALLGVDDRVVVSDTLSHPWNTIGYLVVTFPTSVSFRCTGVLVSAYVVLTAGHCIHDQNLGGFFDSATFYPGQYQSPQGSGSVIRPYANSDVAFARTTEAWTQISGEDAYPVNEYRNDIAAIQFDTPFTFTSTFMPVLFGDTTSSVTSSGYPASVRGQSTFSQYFASGPETTVSNTYRSFFVREFAVDGSGGNSGGPFFSTDTPTNQQRLVGLLSYADAINDQSGGPWYSSFNQSLISDWMSFIPQSAASVEGLRVPAVFSSTQSNSRSFLRFFNSGSSAGTVEVTLANYQTGDTLGAWTSSSIPAGAELQFFIQDIEDGLGQTFPIPDFYSVSIRPSFSGYFQHVLWKPADGTLTNLSTCNTGTVTDFTTAIGVHSSLLQNGYPSSIVIHNTGTSNSIASLGVYDARNGKKITSYLAGSVSANGQLIVQVADLESGVFPPINPSGDMYHYVITLENSFPGYIQHLVNNETVGVITDMTAVCALTPQ